MANTREVLLPVGADKVLITPENSVVNIYRQEEDVDKINIQVSTARSSENDGPPPKLIFGNARAVIYLSGIVVPAAQITAREAEILSKQLYEEQGWNADVVIKDRAPDSIKERFLAYTALREERLDQIMTHYGPEIHEGFSGLLGVATRSLSEEQIALELAGHSYGLAQDLKLLEVFPVLNPKGEK